jgi:hypothetical protein
MPHRKFLNSFLAIILKEVSQSPPNEGNSFVSKFMTARSREREREKERGRSGVEGDFLS